MGFLRWLFGSHRSKDEDDEEERADAWKKGKKARHGRSEPGYRIHVDGESQAMKGEGPPFSFWSSARIILILSFLLWWIQPAGPMIAGYVGGRRSGSPMKGVLAALLPVAIVLIANTAYTRGVGNTQIDLVASLPQAFAGGAASIMPFLVPYKDFLIGYMSGFVRALQSTFGMGTNGYLMVLIFAYIGGLIADQTRRELFYKSGSSQSVGFNLIQPLFGGRHPVADDGYEEYEEDDEELRQLRRPVRAHGRHRGEVEIHTGSRRRRHHGRPSRFEDYRKLGTDDYEDRRSRHPAHARARGEEDEEEDEAVLASRSHRAARDRRARAQDARDEDEDEEADDEADARREAQEARHPRQRSHEEEVRIQRFVERALRNYDHAAR